MTFDVRMLICKASQSRRSWSGIGNANTSTRAGGPPDDRQSGVTKAKNQNFLAMPVHLYLDFYLSFNVDNPNSTSIIVMIQNLTTTWFSFQPFNSKW